MSAYREIIAERLDILGQIRPLVEQGALKFESSYIATDSVLNQDLDRLYDEWNSKF